MEERRVADKNLRCASCGEGFVFSCGEQELFRLRGVSTEPAHCPSCSRGHSLAAIARSTSKRGRQ